jgi:AraC family transcriptional regulator
MQPETPGSGNRLTPDERLDFLPYPPAATSGPLGWSGLRTEHFRGMPDTEVNLPSLSHHLLLLYRRPPERFALRCEDVDRKGPPMPGSLIVIPAGTPTRWDWHGSCDSSQVQLEPGLLARVAAEEFGLDAERAALAPFFDVTEPRIRTAVEGLHAELTSGGPGGKLLAESLGNVLAVHLLRRFAGRAAPRSGGVLPRHRLQAVVEYVEEHLDSGLTLDRLAAVAHQSPYHFARLFKNSTGLPPHQYVISRRVERAKELLRGPDEPQLADVAVDVGFASQSHLTRHFKRLVGVTPARFR